jgi:hypothetical protein
MVPEQFHHWRVYADCGVCVELKRDALLRHIDNLKNKNIRYKKVCYRSLISLKKDIESGRVKVEDLPFLKRLAYKGEEEYRIIYQSNSEGIEKFPIKIKVGMIKKITFSQKIPQFLDISTMIKSIPGCKNIEINQSTLLSSDSWKELVDNVCKKTGTDTTFLLSK